MTAVFTQNIKPPKKGSCYTRAFCATQRESHSELPAAAPVMRINKGDPRLLASRCSKV